MNAAFWNLFTSDYKYNCLKWEHNKENPVIPAGTKPWKKKWTANPHFLEINGKILLYYRGHGTSPDKPDEYHDRISAAKVESIGRSGIIIADHNDDYAAINSGNKDEFDEYHALDPGVIEYNGKVYIYYSGIGKGSPATDSIGLAMSDDGIHFKKLGKVMIGRGPSAIVWKSNIHLIYQILDEENRYKLYLSQGDDPMNLQSMTDFIFEGLMMPNGWDSYSITTPRLYADGDHVYMLYGGSSYLTDEPDYFGLARTKDMMKWEQHPGNPIFGCGPKGSPDGGAIWSPALLETKEGFALLYEGSPGKYSWSLDSQICMSWINKK